MRLGPSDVAQGVRLARQQGVLGGTYLGRPGPILPVNHYFIPRHMSKAPSGTTVSTTGARYYCVFFDVEYPTTFAGAWTYNSNTTDNGDKVKIAAYNESSSGGPGTLAKNFGEVTLTGASAVRTFASSWTAAPGKYYLEFVTDNAADFYCMVTADNTTDVGYFPGTPIPNVFGELSVTVDTGWARVVPQAEYVAGTYANFPEATSLTMTATLKQGAVSRPPLFGLYT